MAENNVFAISSNPTRHQDQLRKFTVFQTFLSANDPEHIGGEWRREFIRNPVLFSWFDPVVGSEPQIARVRLTSQASTEHRPPLK